MAAEAYVKIEGAEALDELFTRLGDKADKVMKRAMREAAQKTNRKIREKTPQGIDNAGLQFKTVVKAIRGSGMYVETGVFGVDRDEGREIPEWFKYYWKNSGTMAGRDPQHRFTNPVRKGSPKNPDGQKYTRFFEEATEGEAENIAREVSDKINALIEETQREL